MGLSKNIPKIGHKYNCFDDGKIKKQRQYVIEICDILKFKNAPADILLLWKKESSNSPWLYKETTDLFVIGKNLTHNSKEIFVRTNDNSWFGIGGIYQICGRLDINKTLTKRLAG